MYLKFYRLRAKPFHITPDLEFLFMSSRHKAALDCMEFGLMNNAGIILITGVIGIGKTTLIRRLLKGLDKHIRPACIYNTNLNPDQFLSLILQEFGLESDNGSKSRNIHAIQKTLQGMRGARQSPLLIIDDSQNLKQDVLEEVRWLSGLQDDNGMLLQIMLVGQPELNAKLRHPSMASLRQRIGVSYSLIPFTRQEAESYIRHRLLQGGRSDPLFTPAALDAVYKISGGIPRTINLLCDNALVYGFVDRLQQIDTPVIELVVKEIGTFCSRPTTGSADGGPARQSADLCEEKLVFEEANSCGLADDRQLNKSISLILQKMKKLEERTEKLDRALDITTKELQQVLRDRMIKESRFIEQLILKNTKLKARLEAVQKGENVPVPPTGRPRKKKSE